MLRELRHHPRRLTGNEVYELILAETGDEEAAQEAGTRYVTQQKILDGQQTQPEGP